MSFDELMVLNMGELALSQSLSSRAMSFDIKIIGKLKEIIDSLNPFRAGRCLSTNMNSENFDLYELSQSLSSRAMSFDSFIIIITMEIQSSQSLSSRAMSFDS